MDWEAMEAVLRQEIAAWIQDHPAWQPWTDRLIASDPVTQAQGSFYLGALCGLHHSDADGEAFDAEMARLTRKYLPQDSAGPARHLVEFYADVEDRQLQRWVADVAAEGEDE